MKNLDEILAPIERAMVKLRIAQADPRISEEFRLLLALSAYFEHDAPFGKSCEGVVIWEKFGQQTTPN